MREGATTAKAVGRSTSAGDATLVSVVIPAYNPERFLLEAVASVEKQTHPAWECVIVDDGSDQSEAPAILEALEARRNPRLRVVRQANRGAAAARNTGFRVASGRYIVPLDCDDLLEPEMIELCLAELERDPSCGFIYFDYRVFGDENYLQQPGEYNLYRLLDENFLPSCCLVDKRAWESVGGYDEWHRWSYEDWSFFLNLGKRGYFGRYIPKPLYRYRKHGPGLHETGVERHEANRAHMVEAHPELLSPQGRLAVKRRWAPSICVAAAGDAPDLRGQTLQDYHLLVDVNEREIPSQTTAPVFLWLEGGGRLRPQTLEECVWALQTADWVSWKDTGDAPPPTLAGAAGPLGVSRAMFEAPEPKPSGHLRRLPWRSRSSAPPAPPAPSATPPLPSQPAALSETGFWGRLHRHLYNAEVLSFEAWLRHPLRSAARLIPLRLKERINHAAGRPVFDLSFYLRFQPRSALVAGGLVQRTEYLTPQPVPGKRRLALLTPHLGVGGAESVLLEVAGQVDRTRWEVLVIATQSRDRRLLPEWLTVADYVYDLGKLMPMEHVPGAVYSMALNWGFDAIVVQNSLAAYSALPAIKQKRPRTRILDLLHAVDPEWDFFSATLDVADAIDLRVAISEAGRERLIEMQTPEEAIRVIPNGVDLDRFEPSRFDRAELRREWNIPARAFVVAFVGRLDRVKRPLLLADVARELDRLEADEVVFLVAGDGPEHEPLISRISAIGVDRSFRVLGHVDAPEEVLAAADLLILTSEAEGVPLALLESLAMRTPVLACRAGAIEEALSEDCGVLVEPGRDEAVRLAEEIVELSADSQRLEAMGEAGRRYVAAEHALSTAQAGYRGVLAELIGGEN
ncbi:MAG: glycosyltransferase [Bryobacterales bacterium]